MKALKDIKRFAPFSIVENQKTFQRYRYLHRPKKASATQQQRCQHDHQQQERLLEHSPVDRDDESQQTTFLLPVYSSLHLFSSPTRQTEGED
ncbi:hypothetical protein B9Z55_008408 [Caenorhabditis nigoni]|uniref:Uncharacterized protein n=1 Tax=Caenorhabditis nigoni TaxID=1611254 RepID=A0A2G5UML1_9PELO|nr:hypothetical protein B9Z55_008408 [Caenorhabditis nigoni]